MTYNKSRSAMRGGFFLLTTLCLLFAAAGCKPTERNYQEAYDKALLKREAKDPDADIIFGNHETISPLGAIRENINGIELMSLRTPLTFIEGDSALTRNRYRIAVALYAMPANARAHAGSLAQKKQRSGGSSNTTARSGGSSNAGTNEIPSVGVMRGGEDRFFVIFDSRPNLKEAAALLDSIRTLDPPVRYIGLHQQEPLLLISPR